MTALPGERNWIGFDHGGTKMHAIVCDRQFQIIARRKKKTRGHEGAEAGFQRICSIIDKLLEETQMRRDQIAGIGIGMPGPIEMTHGIVLEAPNLGWKQVPLREWLEKQYDSPVAVCNDVDAGVFGEYRFGAAAGARTALGVFPGTGIGAGLIYEGKIFHGLKSSCFELGHVPVVPDGSPCGCGRRGCLETVASRLAISAEVAKAAYRGQAPHLLRVAGTDLANIRSGALAEAIQEGDKIVEQILRDGARALGVVMAGVVNLVLPDVIVLGGGLVEALPKIFLEEVGEQIKHRVMPAFVKSTDLRVAKLGDDAGALGCAAWVEQQQPPAETLPPQA